MIKNIYTLLIMVIMTSVFMVSCEEEYMIDTGDFESKLVVNALFNHESPWSINVSNTTNILDHSTEIEKITNAIVEIYDQDNEFIYRLNHVGNGNYSNGDFSPSPKRGYSVKVSAVGYHTVTAKSFVPEESKLLINKSTIIHNETYDDVEVDFEIEDRSKLESYYIWEIVSIDESNGGSLTDPLSKSWLDDLTNKSNDLVEGGREILEGNSFGDGTYRGSYSSSGGNKRIGIIKNNDPLVNYVQELSPIGKIDPNINLPNEVQHNSGIDEDPIYSEDGEKVVFKYELRVMSISKELYDYYSSVEEYIKYNNDSDAVPYGIYTNVTNGLGIFAGFSESVIQF
jgi:hypothetical protein